MCTLHESYGLVHNYAYALPTVKSSNSGKTGMVHPSGSNVAVNCPIVTNGSTLMTCKPHGPGFSIKELSKKLQKIEQKMEKMRIVITWRSTSMLTISTRSTDTLKRLLLYLGCLKLIVCQPGRAVHIFCLLPSAAHCLTFKKWKDMH